MVELPPAVWLVTEFVMHKHVRCTNDSGPLATSQTLRVFDEWRENKVVVRHNQAISCLFDALRIFTPRPRFQIESLRRATCEGLWTRHTADRYAAFSAHAYAVQSLRYALTCDWVTSCPGNFDKGRSRKHPCSPLGTYMGRLSSTTALSGEKRSKTGNLHTRCLLHIMAFALAAVRDVLDKLPDRKRTM